MIINITLMLLVAGVFIVAFAVSDKSSKEIVGFSMQSVPAFAAISLVVYWWGENLMEAIMLMEFTKAALAFAIIYGVFIGTLFASLISRLRRQKYE